MLHDDKLRSEGLVAFQQVSCLDGDTEPEDRLEGDGGVGEVPDWCCQGTVPGGDKVTGTTFLTEKLSVLSNPRDHGT